MDKDDHAFEVYLARGSNLSQRYRAEALEKPSAAMDSDILKASRRSPVYLPEVTVRPWYKRWQVPISIAAVFFFGIGVTWRTVMQEAKLSQPALIVKEPDYAPAKPASAPAEETKATAAPPPSPAAAPAVIMDGTMSPAPAEEKAKALPDLRRAEPANSAPPEMDKLREPAAPKAQSLPAPPVMEKEKARPIPPLPEAAPSKPAGDVAAESKAGSASSGSALKKSAPDVLMEQRDAAPGLGNSNENNAARDAAPGPSKQESARKQDDAPQQAMELTKPAPKSVAPPALELPTPKVRDDATPKAGDGPRLPEGHRPVVDGKTYRSREAAPAPAAKKEPDAAAPIVVEDQTEAPELWLKRIAELRRAGKADEADAQLKRLRERYPDFPITNDK